MALTLFDFILFGVTLVSGLLALMRGFTREVLSLVAWALGAFAGYFASQQPGLTNLLLPTLDKPLFAQVAVGLAAFLVTLIIVSIMSVKISDAVVDSSAGAIDRTLGFVYGLARGLVLVALAYMLYSWAQPPESQEEWIKNAQTLSLVQQTSETIKGLLPPDIASVLSTVPLPETAQPMGDVTQPAPDVTPDATQPAQPTQQQQVQ